MQNLLSNCFTGKCLSVSPLPPPTFLWSCGPPLLLRIGRERHIHFQHLFLRDMIQRVVLRCGLFAVLQLLQRKSALSILFVALRHIHPPRVNMVLRITEEDTAVIS